MNAHELLESLSLLDENERIEAKRAQDAGKSMLETICAFANEPQLGGGWLLLGVVPDEQALFPGYAVEGVANPDKLSADLASQCASTFNTPLRVEIRTESLQGKPVVVVRVPEASAQEKPVYFKATGLPRGAFRRIGSTDQRCTEDDLEALFVLIRDFLDQKSNDENVGFLERLSEITIEGPEDFSENFDLYLSGEKSLDAALR